LGQVFGRHWVNCGFINLILDKKRTGHMSKRQFMIALVVVGALVLVGAAFAYSYTEFGEEFVPGLEPHYRGLTITPYRDFVFPLVLVSASLFFVGFALILGRKRFSGQA